LTTSESNPIRVCFPNGIPEGVLVLHKSKKSPKTFSFLNWFSFSIQSWKWLNFGDSKYLSVLF
jgi:hypothetical protein